MTAAAWQPELAAPDGGTVETARARGLAACECCGLVARAPAGIAQACPRCGCGLHVRKPRSLQRTTAFLLAAVVLYIPANLLPVMTTVSVFGPYAHTLLGGIAELWLSDPALAVVVFIASIAVPVFKIAVLGMLVWTARRASVWRQRGRTKVYRLIENVGHWSMLDVFVVVLLVGMVRFGAFASVRPQAGLLAFGAVVVLTMLASASFDPRLIWPTAREARQGG
jgi:paraquat-inducible protein A